MFIIKHRQLQVAVSLNFELKDEESADPFAGMAWRAVVPNRAVSLLMSNCNISSKNDEKSVTG